LPFSLRGYSEKYFKKLTGNREVEDSLEKLDKLTQEEARMASAEQLKMTHGVDDRVRGVGSQVQDVRGDVQGVGNKVQDVEDRAQVIDSNIRGVDDKLDQANRLSSH
jgi:methyl-accepting chemotaxis protein